MGGYAVASANDRRGTALAAQDVGAALGLDISASLLNQCSNQGQHPPRWRRVSRECAVPKVLCASTEEGHSLQSTQGPCHVASARSLEPAVNFDRMYQATIRFFNLRR
jgi:hypothetical protein